MIYKVSDGDKEVFVISSHGCWLPGSYESRRAANYAFRLDDKELQELQDRANARDCGTGGVITFDDIKKFRKNEMTDIEEVADSIEKEGSSAYTFTLEDDMREIDGVCL